jgi:hypothetical protein
VARQRSGTGCGDLGPLAIVATMIEVANRWWTVAMVEQVR